MRRTDFPLPASWDRDGLKGIGFSGFVPLAQLDLNLVPIAHGVYVVLRSEWERQHEFLAESPLKPYSIEKLQSGWIAGAHVVYIGKAASAKGLRDRLRQYSRKRANHSGGRSVWQLRESGELLVCWIETPGVDPDRVEDDFLEDFQRVHGAKPFANIKNARHP